MLYFLTFGGCFVYVVSSLPDKLMINIIYRPQFRFSNIDKLDSKQITTGNYIRHLFVKTQESIRYTHPQNNNNNIQGDYVVGGTGFITPCVDVI